MKKLFYIFCLVLLFGCSQDDDFNMMPEKFDIRVEIVGANYTPVMKTLITVNGIPIYSLGEEYLPIFIETTYYTKQSESRSIEINVLSYLAPINEIREYNLFINGELVDSKNNISPLRPNGTMNYTVLKYTY